MTYDNKKIVIFSPLLAFLDLVSEAVRRDARFQNKMITVLRYDGETSDQERERTLSKFKQTDCNGVLLITPGAGGFGLELQMAEHVIIDAPWWNDNWERQAIKRVHRGGQTQEVHVWKLRALNSIIDYLIEGAASRKQEVNEEIMKWICREDGEEPNIPRILKGGIGEY